jgi:hypothetical protein
MLRIITEDKNRAMIYKALSGYDVDYTMTLATGTWKGIREDSITIDFIGVETEIVHEIARVIKLHNEQEAVLVLDIPATALFL